MANVAGAQEVVLSTSGGLGEAETAGVIMNVIPRDGGQHVQRHVLRVRRERLDAGQQLHAGTEGPGTEDAVGAPEGVRRQPMGGGRIVRDRLWFYLTYREWGAENTVPGMWINKNAGDPNAWTVDFDKSRQAFDDNKQRNGIARITWQATPRNKINLHWSEQYNSQSTKGGGTATQTIEATGRRAVPAFAHPAGELVIADHEPNPRRGRLGLVSGPAPRRRPGATRGRHA